MSQIDKLLFLKMERRAPKTMCVNITMIYFWLIWGNESAQNSLQSWHEVAIWKPINSTVVGQNDCESAGHHLFIDVIHVFGSKK